MISIALRKMVKLDYLLLVPILGLAFYIAFIPHQDYPYPVHVDEWVHFAQSNAIIQSGGIPYTEPFQGEKTIGVANNLEASFQLFWGVFQNMSGIPWTVIFRYFPGIIFMLTVLSVYILARREGFGLEAALFTALIPSTVGILGPAFLVPVSLGLVFTPLILFIAFNFRGIASYLLLSVFISFLLAIHAPSAIAPIIVLVPYILLNLKSNFKHSLGMALALMLPFFAIFPWIASLLLPTFTNLFIPQFPTEFVQLPRVIQTYGYLPVAACLLGTFVLGIKGGKKNYGLTLGLLFLLLMLVTFYTFHYGVPIVYERGLMYMMLMIGIVGGAGLMLVRTIRLPDEFSTQLKVPFLTRNVGKFLWLAGIAVLVMLVLPPRLNTPFYHMIDKEDYEAFVWIKENIGEDYQKAILDPWKATAFTAITGKNIYTRIHNFATDEDSAAYNFLADGSSNTTFLREKGISIIYTRVYDREKDNHDEYDSDNPDLVKMTKNIYLLKAPPAK